MHITHRPASISPAPISPASNPNSTPNSKTHAPQAPAPQRKQEALDKNAVPDDVMQLVRDVQKGKYGNKLLFGDKSLAVLGIDLMPPDIILDWQKKGLEVSKESLMDLGKAFADAGMKSESQGAGASFSFNAYAFIKRNQAVPDWFLKEEENFINELERNGFKDAAKAFREGQAYIIEPPKHNTNKKGEDDDPLANLRMKNEQEKQRNMQMLEAQKFQVIKKLFDQQSGNSVKQARLYEQTSLNALNTSAPSLSVSTDA